MEQDDGAIELALLRALESGPRTENELARAVGTNPWRVAELLDQMVEDEYIAVLPLDGDSGGAGRASSGGPRFELAPGGIGRLSLRRALAKPGARFIDAALAARVEKKRAMRRRVAGPRAKVEAPEDALRTQVLRMLAAGPRTREDLARRTGVAEDQLGAVLEELVERGLVEGAYELTDAGRVQARWSTQLLHGGAVEGIAHFHGTEWKRRQRKEEAEAQRHDETQRRAAPPPAPPRASRWAAMRAQQREQAMMRLPNPTDPPGRSPVLAGTFRWWIEVVLQGLLGGAALVASVLMLILEHHPDKVLHAATVMLVGGTLLFRATRAHHGAP
ncbi:hypothetical protein [Kribbella sp. NPDC051770]|uniref:DprA-like winged helix domain-containing protein n=1 Tax=Kribbella sp. NPDC051770 TaxID=3155413 RepID=UPI00343159F4